MISQTTILETLSQLEQKESALLSWGMVNSFLNHDDIIDSINEVNHRNQSTDDPEQVLLALKTRKLILEFPDTLTGQIYRTRMSETVRLLVSLKQWLFHHQDWTASPNLVSDFRFITQPRHYPRRDIPLTAIIEELTSLNLLSPLKHEVITTLGTSPNGDNLSFSGFQQVSIRQILEDLTRQGQRGVIISAGTGTGKTLAFYIPALLHITQRITSQTKRTQCFAIYPRNELLKDQFSELYSLVHKLNEWMPNRIGRKLTIGTYYGQTPRSIDQIQSSWEPIGNDFICPFLRCPECLGVLVFNSSSLQTRTETLRCKEFPNCTGQISGDEVLLTREKVRNSPPDILFTTTETLNRNLSNGYDSKVFGVNTQGSKIILLDEIHSYNGVHGAQIAGLLKRWIHLLGRDIHFTGLSATLPNAKDQLHRLTGINEARISEIEPRDDEMENEGSEYQLVLRGDPVSGASLLSTTIQTCMLLPRMLDPRTPNNGSNGPSEGIVGSKVFVFTDDLDVTNRLYHNLMDAEAVNKFGNPLPHRYPLASLRSRQQDEPVRRQYVGQNWGSTEEIGHPEFLRKPLIVTRTSSQDSGVEENSNVIVATASLEVGFNDPTVGAIVQHKSPYNPASFIQRKGRAGRTRLMRPWTIAVLSDYGRDRSSYQSYDLLLNPSLLSYSLPTSNRYILRMQAVLSFFDWLCQELQPQQVNLWQMSSSPNNNDGVAPVIRLIEETLINKNRQTKLAKYLSESLQIEENVTQALMWDHPRPLMTMVLPTMHRRLSSNWRQVQTIGEDTQEAYVRDSPLPEFIPRALFYDLNLPEVEIKLPPGHQPQYMPILQAIKEFAPGRVTRRFGVMSGQDSHWIKPNSLLDTQQNLPISESWIEFSAINTFYIPDPTHLTPLKCIRPTSFKVDVPPSGVRITSNSRLNWDTDISPKSEGHVISILGIPTWEGIIEKVRVFLHNRHDPVVVSRYSRSTNCSLSLKPARRLDININFVDEDDETPVALGFQQEVDGLLFSVKIPESFKLTHSNTEDSRVRAGRTSYFEHKVLNDVLLGETTSSFERDWLTQICLSAITSTAVSQNLSIKQTITHISQQGPSILEEALVTIFQTLSIDDSSESGDDSQDPADHPTRTQQRLVDLCRDNTVRTRLLEIAHVLHAEDPDWYNWTIDRFFATVGGALLEACIQSSSGVNDGDLLLDIKKLKQSSNTNQADDNIGHIWITESNIGGNGIIEEVAILLSTDPQLFFQLVESGLQSTDRELIDSELTRLINLIQSDREVRDLVTQIRIADGHERMFKLNTELKQTLSKNGMIPNYPVISSIYARILKPGTSNQTDLMLLNLINGYTKHEEMLGMEIDPRVFSFIASSDDQIKQGFSGVAPPHQIEDRNWRFQAILSLLWARGRKIRSMSLNSYNPFSELPETDSELLDRILQSEKPLVYLSHADWFPQVEQSLSQVGECILSADIADVTNLKSAIAILSCSPVNIGFLRLYPRISAISRSEFLINVTIQLPEALNL